MSISILNLNVGRLMVLLCTPVILVVTSSCKSLGSQSTVQTADTADSSESASSAENMNRPVPIYSQEELDSWKNASDREKWLAEWNLTHQCPPYSTPVFMPYTGESESACYKGTYTKDFTPHGLGYVRSNHIRAIDTSYPVVNALP